jgi:hypothetical protein
LPCRFEDSLESIRMMSTAVRGAASATLRNATVTSAWLASASARLSTLRVGPAVLNRFCPGAT